MNSSVASFCSLSDLLDWTLSDPPAAQCAYLVRGNKSCSRPISRKKCNSVRSLFANLFDVLNELSGVFNDKTPLFEVFDEIVKIVICGNHAKYATEVRDQWLRELDFKKTRLCISSKLEEYYGVGKGDDSDEKEDESALSGQPSSTGFVRRTPDIQVPEKVTKVLEQKLGGTDKKSGWNYIISSPNFPAMLKIGFTIYPPEIQRFQTHKRCYQEFDVITTDLIPYARRVEQLVLAEFSRVHCERTEKCQKCDSTHREWLEIDKETLLGSLNKWIRFAETYPYNQQGKLKRDAVLPSPALSRHGRRRVSATPTKKGRHQSSQLISQSATDESDSDSENCESASKKDKKKDKKKDDFSSRLRQLQISS